jgi:hypothetical protein
LGSLHIEDLGVVRPRHVIPIAAHRFGAVERVDPPLVVSGCVVAVASRRVFLVVDRGVVSALRDRQECVARECDEACT